MMTLHRFNETEDKLLPERSERFYQIGNDWYFAVRKGADQGPYPGKDEARAALRTYIIEQLAEEKRRPQEADRRFSMKSLFT